ncbi:unnamed protein product [Camellia sinensis]
MQLFLQNNLMGALLLLSISCFLRHDLKTSFSIYIQKSELLDRINGVLVVVKHIGLVSKLLLQISVFVGIHCSFLASISYLME